MRETTVAKLKQLSLQTNCTAYKYSRANISWRAFNIYFYVVQGRAVCNTAFFYAAASLFYMRLVQFLESELWLLQH